MQPPVLCFCFFIFFPTTWGSHAISPSRLLVVAAVEVDATWVRDGSLSSGRCLLGNADAWLDPERRWQLNPAHMAAQGPQHAKQPNDSCDQTGAERLQTFGSQVLEPLLECVLCNSDKFCFYFIIFHPRPGSSAKHRQRRTCKLLLLSTTTVLHLVHLAVCKWPPYMSLNPYAMHLLRAVFMVELHLDHKEPLVLVTL